MDYKSKMIVNYNLGPLFPWNPLIDGKPNRTDMYLIEKPKHPSVLARTLPLGEQDSSAAHGKNTTSHRAPEGVNREPKSCLSIIFNK